MSSPSSVFTLPEEDFEHCHEGCDNDNVAFHGTPSSSSSDTECCYSPIFSRGSSKAMIDDCQSKKNTAVDMSEIMKSTARWNQANHNNTMLTSPLRSIFGNSAAVFSTLSMDDDGDENDHADDNDHNNRRKEEDWKKSAAAGAASCRRRQSDGRLIMPRWLAVSLLLTLTVSVIFFTKATWWTTTTAGAGAGVRGIRRPISITSNNKNHNAATPSTTTTTTAYQDLLLSILKTLTPRRTLLNTSTPQGQAFAWLLESVAPPVSTVDKDKEEEEDDSLTRMRRRMRHLLEQQQQPQPNDDVLSSKRQQVLERYVIVTLDFALHASTSANTSSSSQNTTFFTPAVARANLPTCQWPGISCQMVDGQRKSDKNVFVKHVSWPGFNLTGKIPEEIKGLRYLMHLDLAENDLVGTLPSGLFGLSRLKNLYLHQNRLGGTLNGDDNDHNENNNDNTTRVGGRLQGFAQLRQLENVYLGNNFFHGPFPTGLNARGGKLLELRYLSLYQNRLTGPVPEDLNWHKMVFLDLSYNQFNGTLPVDWCLEKNVTVQVEQQNNDTAISTTNTTTTVTETRTKITTSLPNIRYLFLNHNQFSGTIPADLPSVLGNGRVELLHLGDNEFHGHVPGNYSKSRIFMTSLEVQNNHFTSMDPYICTLSVLTPPDGELVNLRADCPICTCPSLCATPCPNNTFITSSHYHHNRTKQNTEGNQKNETLSSTSDTAAAIVGGEHY